jgi:hypothetical protein
MNPIRSFVIRLAFLLTLTCISATAGESYGIAKVVRKMGDARYFMAGDSTPHDIKIGMILKPGVTIQTGSGTGNYVDLVLNNASADTSPARTPTPFELAHWQPKAERDGIRIFDNTVLAINKLSRNLTGADVFTEIELDLKAGNILGTVTKLTPSSKYEVKIPKGVAGIRGTIYFLSASGILNVFHGSVVVAYVGPDGNVITQIVNADEQFDTNTGLLTPLDVDGVGWRRVVFAFAVVDYRPISVIGTESFFARDQRIYFVSPVVGNVRAGANGGGRRGSFAVSN